MDCSPPGFSVHGTFLASLLELVPFLIPGDLPHPRDRTGISGVSCVGRRILCPWCPLVERLSETGENNSASPGVTVLGRSRAERKRCCRDSQLQGPHPLVGRFLGIEGHALRSPQQLLANQLHLFLSLSQIWALCSELS